MAIIVRKKKMPECCEAAKIATSVDRNFKQKVAKFWKKPKRPTCKHF